MLFFLARKKRGLLAPLFTGARKKPKGSLFCRSPLVCRSYSLSEANCSRARASNISASSHSFIPISKLEGEKEDNHGPQGQRIVGSDGREEAAPHGESEVEGSEALIGSPMGLVGLAMLAVLGRLGLLDLHDRSPLSAALLI